MREIKFYWYIRSNRNRFQCSTYTTIIDLSIIDVEFHSVPVSIVIVGSCIHLKIALCCSDSREILPGKIERYFLSVKTLTYSINGRFLKSYKITVHIYIYQIQAACFYRRSSVTAYNIIDICTQRGKTFRIRFFRCPFNSLTSIEILDSPECTITKLSHRGHLYHICRIPIPVSKFISNHI